MTQQTTSSLSPIHILLHLIIGILFGAGLAISEMANPNAVLSFLDISALFTHDSPFNQEGNWNPGLIMVMIAAIAASFIAYQIKGKLKHPLLSLRWVLPKRKDIDAPLLIGAGLFGVGWGLSGYCPGPAVTALTNSPIEAVYFLGAMLVGSAAFQYSPFASTN